MAVNDLKNSTDIIYRAHCYTCGCSFTQIREITNKDIIPCIKCNSDNIIPEELIKASNQKRIIPNYKTETK